MLYLLRPNAPLTWNDDLPTRALLDLAKSEGIDLGKMDWKPSDREVTLDLIRLALRHGIACSTGIAVQAIVFEQEKRPRELRAIHAEAVAARAKAYTPDLEAFFEAITPGWGENDRELNERVDTSVEASVRDAEAVRAKLFDAEPVGPLVEHWRSLGGFDPGSI
jgi:hypothetical protein